MKAVRAPQAFPADAIARAQKYLSSGDSMGAYSESQGLLAVRREVAEFLTRRDGYEGSPVNM
jgi:aspartate/methionine/tyrosine aminotransferase